MQSIGSSSASRSAVLDVKSASVPMPPWKGQLRTAIEDAWRSRTLEQMSAAGKQPTRQDHRELQEFIAESSTALATEIGDQVKSGSFDMQCLTPDAQDLVRRMDAKGWQALEDGARAKPRCPGIQAATIVLDSSNAATLKQVCSTLDTLGNLQQLTLRVHGPGAKLEIDLRKLRTETLHSVTIEGFPAIVARVLVDARVRVHGVALSPASVVVPHENGQVQSPIPMASPMPPARPVQLTDLGMAASPGGPHRDEQEATGRKNVVNFLRGVSLAGVKDEVPVNQAVRMLSRIMGRSPRAYVDFSGFGAVVAERMVEMSRAFRSNGTFVLEVGGHVMGLWLSFDRRKWEARLFDPSTQRIAELSATGPDPILFG